MNNNIPMTSNDEFDPKNLENKNLHHLAQYTICDDEQNEKIKLVRYAFSEMYKSIEIMCKHSRERSLALTKLEEAQMWAIKGITREKDTTYKSIGGI